MNWRFNPANFDRIQGTFEKSSPCNVDLQSNKPTVFAFPFETGIQRNDHIQTVSFLFKLSQSSGIKQMLIIFKNSENHKIDYSLDNSLGLTYKMNDAIEKEQNTVLSEVNIDGLKYQLMYCRRSYQNNKVDCALKIISTKNYPVSLMLCDAFDTTGGAINLEGGKHHISNYGCGFAHGARIGGDHGKDLGIPEPFDSYSVNDSPVILPGISYRGFIDIAGVYPDDIAFRELNFTSYISNIQDGKFIKKIEIKFTNLTIPLLPKL